MAVHTPPCAYLPTFSISSPSISKFGCSKLTEDLVERWEIPDSKFVGTRVTGRKPGQKHIFH
jgi:hypothetical protein